MNLPDLSHLHSEISRLAGIVLLMQGACAYAAPAPEPESLLLARNGKSAYRIVIAEKASPSVLHGAEELQTFLNEITGATLPIVSDREPLAEKEILLGNSAHVAQAGISMDFASLGLEGYHLKTEGKRLLIAGGSVRGALYGVYGFLEDHLGCRWFAPDVRHIPQRKKLKIPPLDDRQIPKLEYRDVFTFECFDGDWAARNRSTSQFARLEEKHGGKTGIVSLAHTFYALVPPSQHFDTHPEYFSLVNGARLRDDNYGQLCCTNKEVIEICIQETLSQMRANPTMRVFSVSQSDTFPEAPNYCECENCQKLAREEESQMGPVLALVNRVAEAVEREFPENTVETLAYRWTRKPPKNLRPRKNVLICLCTAECCFVHPFESCDYAQSRAFRDDIEAWGKTGARLWVWNYVTSFSDYLLPFPSQRYLRQNIRFFVRSGVTGIFEQDAYNTPNSELAALGGYMTAKFLWNPDYDEDKAAREFLAAYYGPAAKPIRRYMDLLNERVEEENIHLGIDAAILARPSSAHVKKDFLLRANRLWETAERKAADNPEFLKRVQTSRLSVDYAIVERTRMALSGNLPIDDALHALARTRVEQYLKNLEAAGIERLCEWRPFDLSQYIKDLTKELGVPSPE
jgi:hypothetical protein